MPQINPAPGSVAYEEQVWSQGVFVPNLSPQDAIQRTVAHMVGRGYPLVSRQENSATFSHHEGPDVWAGCFLLLLFLLPGILYFILAGGERHTTLVATAEDNGVRLYAGGDRGASQDELRAWVMELAETPHG